MQYLFSFASDEQINLAQHFPAVGWKWADRASNRRKTPAHHRFSRSWLEEFASTNPQLVGRVPPQLVGNYPPKSTIFNGLRTCRRCSLPADCGSATSLDSYLVSLSAAAVSSGPDHSECAKLRAQLDPG